jgi:kynureninase
MGSIAPEERKMIEKPSFSREAGTKEYAQSLDVKDHMQSFRDKFVIPSKANIKSKRLAKPGEPSILSPAMSGDFADPPPRTLK